jgi:hypothetical protein
MTIPVRVSRASPPDGWSARATPKSVRRARPGAPASDSTSTFSGLRSRCTTPAAWAAASASARSRSTAAASAAGSAPCASSRSRSEPPATYSIANQSSDPASPAAYTCTMCGWRSRATVRASCRKRPRSTALAVSSGAMTLMATGRSSASSRPSHTLPMPPAPSGRSIAYRPASAARSASRSLAGRSADSSSAGARSRGGGRGDGGMRGEGTAGRVRRRCRVGAASATRPGARGPRSLR